MSQLKKHRGEVPDAQQVAIPQCDQNGLLAAHPLKLLDRKMVKKNSAAVVYGLNQWTNGYVEDATWEPLDKLCRDYPDFQLNS